MNLDSIILLGIVAFTILAFAREWMSMDAVALTCLGLLLALDLVTVEEAVSRPDARTEVIDVLGPGSTIRDESAYLQVTS